MYYACITVFTGIILFYGSVDEKVFFGLKMKTFETIDKLRYALMTF